MNQERNQERTHRSCCAAWGCDMSKSRLNIRLFTFPKRGRAKAFELFDFWRRVAKCPRSDFRFVKGTSWLCDDYILPIFIHWHRDLADQMLSRALTKSFQSLSMQVLKHEGKSGEQDVERHNTQRRAQKSFVRRERGTFEYYFPGHWEQCCAFVNSIKPPRTETCRHEKNWLGQSTQAY